MLTDERLSALTAREGHLVTESGCHTDLWLSLDALFVCPGRWGRSSPHGRVIGDVGLGGLVLPRGSRVVQTGQCGS